MLHYLRSSTYRTACWNKHYACRLPWFPATTLPHNACLANNARGVPSRTWCRQGWLCAGRSSEPSVDVVNLTCLTTFPHHPTCPPATPPRFCLTHVDDVTLWPAFWMGGQTWCGLNVDESHPRLPPTFASPPAHAGRPPPHTAPPAGVWADGRACHWWVGRRVVPFPPPHRHPPHRANILPAVRGAPTLFARACHAPVALVDDVVLATFPLQLPYHLPCTDPPCNTMLA